MATSPTYPSSVKSFGLDRIDGTDVVIASDVNSAYAEIVAIETVIGTNPLSTGFGGSYSSASTPATVSARISNVEAGLNTAYTDRVAKSGGSTISSTGTTVGLTLNTSGTGNLFNANNNTVIDNNGYILTIDGGTA